MDIEDIMGKSCIYSNPDITTYYISPTWYGIWVCEKGWHAPQTCNFDEEKDDLPAEYLGYLGYHVFRGHMSRARAIEHRNHPVWGTHHVTKCWCPSECLFPIWYGHGMGKNWEVFIMTCDHTPYPFTHPEIDEDLTTPHTSICQWSSKKMAKICSMIHDVYSMYIMFYNGFLHTCWGSWGFALRLFPYFFTWPTGPRAHGWPWPQEPACSPEQKALQVRPCPWAPYFGDPGEPVPWKKDAEQNDLTLHIFAPFHLVNLVRPRVYHV